MRTMLPFLFALAVADHAAAASFTVSPTTLSLDERPSALLLLTNRSDDPIRFQVTADSWDESETGDALLAPTDDLLVFPTLFVLEPGEQRTIRVGSVRGAEPVEASYRLFVEELPTVGRDGATAVKVRTRVAIPVFVGPDDAAADGRIEAIQLDGGELSTTLFNDGNGHTKVRHVELVARDEDENQVWATSVRGWYLLPGNQRRYAWTVPAEACDDAAVFDIHAKTDSGSWWASVPVDPARCAP